MLMIEKGIRGGIRHTIHRYVKYMKYYDKNKEPPYVNYWDENNLHGWAMSQKLPLGGFKGVEEIFQFNEDFTENYNEDNDKNIFLKLKFNIPKCYMTFTIIYPFCLKE